MSKVTICPVCGYEQSNNESVCIMCGKQFDDVGENNTHDSTTHHAPSRCYTETNHTNTNQQNKKKMPTIIKILLAIFGLQFIIPIIAVIAAMFFGSEMESQVNDAMNAIVNTEIETITITPWNTEDWDNFKKIGIESGAGELEECDGLLKAPLYATSNDNEEIEVVLYIWGSKMESIDLYDENQLRLEYDDMSVSIGLCNTDDEDENVLEMLDIAYSDVEMIRRCDNIKIGEYLFKCYGINGDYILMCNLGNECYLTYTVAPTKDIDESYLADIFKIRIIESEFDKD